MKKLGLVGVFAALLAVSLIAQVTNRGHIQAALTELSAVTQADLSSTDRTSFRNAVTRLQTILGHLPADPVDPPPPPPPPVDPPPPPPPVDPPPTPTGALFSSGWRDLGCTGDIGILLDRGLWGDYGPSWPGTCGIAEVVDVDGVRALQVTQLPGHQNGSDFRIEKGLGSQSEITVTERIKFADNFRFATGDHKTLIIGGQGGQNVYLNVRGTAGNPSQGRITVHVIPVDTAMSDRNVPITVGAWHELKINVKAGTNGYVRVKLDGQLLTLVTEAGNQANPNALNTGSIDFIKPDTTYNIGSFITEPMRVWYDYVTVERGNATF